MAVRRIASRILFSRLRAYPAVQGIAEPWVAKIERKNAGLLAHLYLLHIFFVL